jgi:hypothetical protein
MYSKMTYVGLFCRTDSAYKNRENWDVYDIDRDAKTYDKSDPVVCHPPCRAWGMLSHMANPRPGEKELALWSIKKVQKLGGIVEHPSGSKLWKIDHENGFVIEIDQYDFGHVAHKKTKLFISGIRQDDLPPLPPKDETIHLCPKGKRRSICGNVKGTTRCTQYQREYTPEKLIDWFELVLNRIYSLRSV